MTVEGYQTIYHSSIAYGRQKAVQAEAGVADLEERLRQLQTQQHHLQEQKQQLTHRLLVSLPSLIGLTTLVGMKCCVLQYVEAMAAEDERKQHARHRGLVQFLHNQHAQLETFHNALTQEPTWK